ncbi:MAG: hypothetical protein LBT14_13465 [Treponema sp.]|jgi:hypothetical protein|nr:hypothetical protein [Treponema sp.]
MKNPIVCAAFVFLALAIFSPRLAADDPPKAEVRLYGRLMISPKYGYMPWVMKILT